MVCVISDVVVCVCVVCVDGFWFVVLVFGVYSFPKRKFLICVTHHIDSRQVALFSHRALFVNWEIFSNVAGFLLYVVLMSCSQSCISMGNSWDDYGLKTCIIVLLSIFENMIFV